MWVGLIENVGDELGRTSDSTHIIVQIRPRGSCFKEGWPVVRIRGLGILGSKQLSLGGPALISLSLSSGKKEFGVTVHLEEGNF